MHTMSILVLTHLTDMVSCRGEVFVQIRMHTMSHVAAGSQFSQLPGPYIF